MRYITSTSYSDFALSEAVKYMNNEQDYETAKLLLNHLNKFRNQTTPQVNKLILLLKEKGKNKLSEFVGNHWNELSIASQTQVKSFD